MTASCLAAPAGLRSMRNQSSEQWPSRGVGAVLSGLWAQSRGSYGVTIPRISLRVLTSHKFHSPSTRPGHDFVENLGCFRPRQVSSPGTIAAKVAEKRRRPSWLISGLGAEWTRQNLNQGRLEKGSSCIPNQDSPNEHLRKPERQTPSSSDRPPPSPRQTH